MQADDQLQRGGAYCEQIQGLIADNRLADAITVLEEFANELTPGDAEVRARLTLLRNRQKNIRRNQHQGIANPGEAKAIREGVVEVAFRVLDKVAARHLPTPTVAGTSPAARRVFLSYRREDTEAISGRICDRLVLTFGSDCVFFDIDTLPYGGDFSAHIGSHLKRASVLVVVIGPHWLGSRADGSCRIQDVDDWVRREIELAIELRVPLMPVLVGAALMPAPDLLPESIRRVTHANAAPISMNRDFRVHMDRLIAAIRAV